MTPRALATAGRRAGPSVLRGEDDTRLLELVYHGSEGAFETIVDRYRGPLTRYAAGVVGPDGADEAVQEGLVRAHAALSRGDRVGCLRPWLYRIVRNAALNQVRDRGPLGRELDERDVSLEGPELVAERRQGVRELVAAVKALPLRQRDAIVLRELEGRSYGEIATRLGVSDPAVRGLLNRARAALRRAAAALAPLWPARLAELWSASAAGPSASAARTGAATLLAAAAALGGTSGSDHEAPERSSAARQTQSASAAEPALAVRSEPVPALVAEAAPRSAVATSDPTPAPAPAAPVSIEQPSKPRTAPLDPEPRPSVERAPPPVDRVSFRSGSCLCEVNEPRSADGLPEADDRGGSAGSAGPARSGPGR